MLEVVMTLQENTEPSSKQYIADSARPGAATARYDACQA